jgi:hypothetical protein
MLAHIVSALLRSRAIPASLESDDALKELLSLARHREAAHASEHHESAEMHKDNHSINDSSEPLLCGSDHEHISEMPEDLAEARSDNGLAASSGSNMSVSFHPSWCAQGVELNDDCTVPHVQQHSFVPAESWAYRFAIVGQQLNAARRFAVKVNGSDGKLGSNEALEIGFTSSAPCELNKKRVMKARALPSSWSIDGAGNCWFAADLKTKSVNEAAIRKPGFWCKEFACDMIQTGKIFNGDYMPEDRFAYTPIGRKSKEGLEIALGRKVSFTEAHDCFRWILAKRGAYSWDEDFWLVDVQGGFCEFRKFSKLLFVSNSSACTRTKAFKAKGPHSISTRTPPFQRRSRRWKRGGRVEIECVFS